jgi:hypothetical protein
MVVLRKPIAFGFGFAIGLCGIWLCDFGRALK